MKDKKFLFNLFDKDGNDYEVVVVGKKSASNLFDWIWEELKTEVMMRPLIVDCTFFSYVSPERTIRDDTSGLSRKREEIKNE